MQFPEKEGMITYMEVSRYDLIVIGAGPGGYSGAIRASQLGMKVALIESRDVGGVCLNRGCIPTKTLIHTANLYRELALFDELGISVEHASVDMKKLYTRKEKIVSHLCQGIETLLLSYKVSLYRGHATITGIDSIEVCAGGAMYTLSAKKVLIATGGMPVRPHIPGIDLPGVITSDELLQRFDVLPEKLAIIGGGVIGVEIASVFAAFGVEVTIIEAAARVLPSMDKEISQSIAMLLKKRGVTICSSATVNRIERIEDKLVCFFTVKESSQSVEADRVLVSVGRKASIDGLFANGCNVDFAGGITVDEFFRTSIAKIYAIGDVIAGSAQLAHAAVAQACAAVHHMAGTPEKHNIPVMPVCVYTDPEIACVGISEQQAREQGKSIKIGKFLMSANGKSMIESAERGFVKLVFDADTEVLLGAQLMCARATDIIGELCNAVVNQLTARNLASVIRPHPTLCEAVTEAAESALGRAIHIAHRS